MGTTDEADPLDRAIVRLLHLLTDQWTEYEAVAATEPAERSAGRAINAGLIEAAGVVSFTQLGNATRLVIDARWTGTMLPQQIDCVLAAVPEWFESGKLRAKVAMHPIVQRVRLTALGLVSQGDIRSRERQHIVVRLLKAGATEPGRLVVEAQRAERPLPPQSGTDPF